MSGGNYEIDLKATIEAVKNHALNSMVLKAIPDPSARDLFSKIVHGFNRRGVSTQTVIDVFMEMATEE